MSFLVDDPAAQAVAPRAGQGLKVQLVHSHEEGLLAEPGQLTDSQVRLHVLREDLRVAGDLLGIGQHLFKDRFQKGLLGADAADVLRAIAGAVVVVAEAHHLQGVLPVQMLHALFQVDVQVLIGVVIVHVQGDLKVHAADLVHQLHEGFQVHLHREVHGDAQGVGHRFPHLVHAAEIVGIVDLAGLAVDVDAGIPGDADAGDGLVFGVEAHQDIGVGAAVVIVQTGDQDGEEVVLALLHRLGLGADGGGRGDVLGGRARRGGLYLGLADEAGVDPGQDGQDEHD